MANHGYLVYLDDVLLPVAPSNITLKVKNQNKTINLIDGSEINILHSAGLSEIDFSFDIPQLTKYPFAVYRNNEFKDLTYYTNKLEDLKVNKKSFQFKVIRRSPIGKPLYDTNITVSLEDYSIADDVKNGFDVSISVKLKQYIPYKTKKLVIASDNTATPSNTGRVSTKDIPDTYTVKAGDTLWAIADEYMDTTYYANRTDYMNEIMSLNGMVSDSLISGQMLIVPYYSVN